VGVSAARGGGDTLNRPARLLAPKRDGRDAGCGHPFPERDRV